MLQEPRKGAFFVGYDGYSIVKDDGHGLHEVVEVVTIAYYNDSTGETTVSKVDVGQIDNLNVQKLVAAEPNGTKGASDVQVPQLLDASDRRINDVKVIGNDLFAVTEVVPKNSSVPNVHWFDFGFDVTDPTHLVVFLKAQGDLQTDLPPLIWTGVTTFNGSIAGDTAGNLVLNFTASGPNLPPADYFAIHRSTDTDPAHFWEAPVQYAHSDTPYSDGGKISRWGDYSSAVVDPSAAVDPTHPHGFLISNEYAVDASHWGTKIADLWLA